MTCNYQVHVTVLSGRLETLKGRVDGKRWFAEFSGTATLVPRSMAELPTDILLTGSSDGLLEEHDPILSLRWLGERMGDSLADTLNSINLKLISDSLRVNGIEAEGAERHAEWNEVINTHRSKITIAIREQLPFVQLTR